MKKTQMKKTQNNFRDKIILVMLLTVMLITNVTMKSYAENINDTYKCIKKCDMKEKRVHSNAVVLGNKIYVLGGSDSTSLNSLEEYDYETNTWIKKASMNDKRRYANALTIDGKIYAIGGWNETAIAMVEEYNPITNLWVKKAAMNERRETANAIVLNNKIYVIGGYNSTSRQLSTVEEYNSSTNLWTKKAPMNEKRQYAQAVELDGKIYVLGGRDEKGVIGTVEEYNPMTDKWTKKASMNFKRENANAIAIDGKIYIIGGKNEQGTLSSVEEYDPITNEWIQKADMKGKRERASAVVINNKFYVMGGFDGNYLSTVEEYNPSTNVWVQKANMNDSRRSANAVILNGKVYIMAGENGSGRLLTLEEITPSLNNVTDIILNKDSIDLEPSKSEILVAKILPKDTAYKNIVWSSSNLKVATVDEYGKVTAIEEGKAIITATTQDGRINALCNVNVAIEESITVESMKNKMNVNGELTIDIVIHGSKNICAEDMKISYNKELFDYIGYENIDGIKVYKELNDNILGEVRFIVASLGKKNAANGDKIVLRVKFKAKKEGKGKIDVIKARIADNGSIEKDILEDKCGEKEIVVIKPLDVNKTGAFTLLDLGIDAWYFGELAVDTDTSKFDTDVVVDNVIDEDDLTTIVAEMLSNDGYKPNM